MSAAAEQQKYRVLLAEDDEVNQQIVMAFLAGTTNIELTVVGDGRSAHVSGAGPARWRALYAAGGHAGCVDQKGRKPGG